MGDEGARGGEAYPPVHPLINVHRENENTSKHVQTDEVALTQLSASYSQEQETVVIMPSRSVD